MDTIDKNGNTVEKTPEQILSEANEDLQKTGKGMLHYDAIGYDYIIAAITMYGQQMYEKGLSERR